MTTMRVSPEYVWVGIREAPCEGAALIGDVLRCGYEYDINLIGERDGYFVISRDGKEAYVRKEFLENVYDHS